MLSADMLAILSGAAAATRDAIIEFGPYIGGSTIAIGQGLQHEHRLFISIEKGGRHEHPTLGTTDILAALSANISRYRLDRSVLVLRKRRKRPASRYHLCWQGNK